MIKKLNSIVSLLCCVSLLGHFVTMTKSMMTGWYNLGVCKNLAHMTGLTVSIHVCLVLIIFFFIHDGSNLSLYGKENMKTIIQRASGLVIMLMVHFHVKNYGFIMSDEPFMMIERIRICVMEIVFFASIFAHLSTSFSKAFISLGLISDCKKINILDIVIRVFCAISMLIVTITMLRFVLAFGV